MQDIYKMGKKKLKKYHRHTQFHNFEFCGKNKRLTHTEKNI